MILTGHQPNYVPYPGFFQKLASADMYLVVDTTQFVKRGPFGWIHRNRIGSPNGAQWLSLPVLHKGRYHQSIAETQLNPRVDWQRKHWKALEWNYAKAPHWERYRAGLEAIYQREWTHIAPLTTELIRWFMSELELTAEVRIASDLTATGNSTEYIVSFCQELGADTYLSGVHGRDYLELELFEQANVELEFQEYTPPSYTGFNGAVAEPNLTMLDMMFWTGDEAKEWVHSVTELNTA